MTRKWIGWFGLVLLASGCWRSVPLAPRPNDISVMVSSWTRERAEWYFANCNLMRTDLVNPWGAWEHGANHALIVSSASLAFQCAEEPPFRPEPLQAWRRRLALAERQGFRCTPGGTEGHDVEVVEQGEGEPIDDDAFVRARERVVAVVAPREVQLHHGRIVEADDGQPAQRVAKGDELPVEEHAIEWVRHTSCWGSCAAPALRAVRLGGKVRYRCGGFVTELEPIEQGDSALLRASLSP